MVAGHNERYGKNLQGKQLPIELELKKIQKTYRESKDKIRYDKD